MRYHYKTLPLEMVVGITTPSLREHQPDSYLSADPVSLELAKILGDGYRWVRSDDRVAVFEQAFPEFGQDFHEDVRTLCTVVAKYRKSHPDLNEALENVTEWGQDDSPQAMGWLDCRGRP